jgi:hypothetical protein
MKNSGNDAKSPGSREVGSSVPVAPTSHSVPAISANPPHSPSDTPSNELPRFEKLKFYTDLYKFYSELPFKICASYSVASTLILAVTANFTKNLRVIGWLTFLIVVIQIFIGRQLYLIDRKYIEPYRDEIESLVKELGLSFGPNFHVMRFILRLSVISFVLLPFGAAMLLFYFVTR